MLQIFANNIELNLPEDISISLVIENPFVVEGRVPVPYSFSFDLPATQTNLKAYDFPERLANYKRNTTIERSVDCVIRFQGLSIAVGKLILTKYEEKLTVNFSGLDFNDLLKGNLSELPLPVIDFPGGYTSSDYSNVNNYAYSYKEWATNNAYSTDGPFVIAPVAKKITEEYRWTIPTRGGGGEFNVRAPNRLVHTPYRLRDKEGVIREWYYNSFNSSLQSHLFTGGFYDGAHSDITPQFRVSYLFNVILGNKLANNPFATNLDLKDLVIPSYQLKFIANTGFKLPNLSDWASFPLVSNMTSHRTGNLPSSDPYIAIADFMPSIAANEFIKEMLGLFCYSIYLKKGKYYIKSNTEILNDSVHLNWSDRLVGQPIIQFTEGKLYDYGYNESVLIYEGNEGYTTVATISDMVNYEYTLDTEFHEYSEQFYISSTRQYFDKYVYRDSFKMIVGYSGRNPIYGDETETITTYTFLGYGIEKISLESKESKYNAKSNIKLTYLAPVPWLNNLEEGKSNTYMTVLPIHEVLESDPNKRESTIELMMYTGPAEVISAPNGVNKNYPALNPIGNSNISLFWDDDNGLLNSFHLPFKNWIEKDKLKISSQFIFTALDLHNLDITDKVHINGRNFFIEKINLSISRTQILLADVDLLEA